MASKLQPGVEHITHEDPEHDHVHSPHDYNGCRTCDCIEVKEVGQHCYHCYHCPLCSDAVATGCRPCTSSPNRIIYGSYVDRRRKDSDVDDALDDHDCDHVKEGDENSEQWYSCMVPPQLPDCYFPDSPLPLHSEEDVAADQAGSEESPKETPPKAENEKS